MPNNHFGGTFGGYMSSMWQQCIIESNTRLNTAQTTILDNFVLMRTLYNARLDVGSSVSDGSGVDMIETQGMQGVVLGNDGQDGGLINELNEAIWQSSTKKKRRMKMNKHKLKKRRKLRQMNTKSSRK